MIPTPSLSGPRSMLFDNSLAVDGVESLVPLLDPVADLVDDGKRTIQTRAGMCLGFMVSTVYGPLQCFIQMAGQVPTTQALSASIESTEIEGGKERKSGASRCQARA